MLDGKVEQIAKDGNGTAHDQISLLLQFKYQKGGNIRQDEKILHMRFFAYQTGIDEDEAVHDN